jgi:hypothetical protein
MRRGSASDAWSQVLLIVVMDRRVMDFRRVLCP